MTDYRYKRADEIEGDGWLDFINAGVGAIKKANNFLTNTRVISRTLKLAGHVTGNQRATDWGNKAAEYGYGHPQYVVAEPMAVDGMVMRKRKRRHRKGKKPGPKTGSHNK